MVTSLSKSTRIVLLLIIFATLLQACGGGVTPSPIASPLPTTTPTQIPTVTPVPPPFPKTIDLHQDLKFYYGMAVTSQKCPKELQGMEAGVILGIDPQTCQIATEEGGLNAFVEITIPKEYVNNVITMKISWPDENERGLKAEEMGKAAYIQLDGKTIWIKNALTLLNSTVYYAAKSEPIVLTFVPKVEGKHKIEIHLPTGMSWDIDSIQFSASPYPANIMGIAYSPYKGCQGPDTDDQPTTASKESDIDMLSQSATAIRTYSAIGANAIIPGMASGKGLPVYAGVWINDSPASGDLSADESEMAGIFDIAKTVPIEAAIIGNEYHLRHIKEEGNLEYLLSRINEFKAAYPEIPVATAEIDSLAFIWSENGEININPAYKPILDQVDIFLVHIYPFWSNMPVDGAAEYTINRYLEIKVLLDKEYGGKKRVIIGEAGWPEQGGPGGNNSGEQSQLSGAQSLITSQVAPVYHPEEQRKYMIELLTLAQQNQVDLFYFDAFDELWKTEGENGAGRSWGYAYFDRSSKYNFSSLLLSLENMPFVNAGDIFTPYTESYFSWGEGSYPIYTEWPNEPKGKPDELAEFRPYTLAYMGNLSYLNILQCSMQSHSGETALAIQFAPDPSLSNGSDWSGAYWLYPKDNWGISTKGQNFSKSKYLSFWARGENGGEVVEFIIGGICGKYNGQKPPLCPDTIQPRASTGSIKLDAYWKQYTFDLSDKDRSKVVGAFGFAVSQIHNPNGANFYLDDIVFSQELPILSTIVYPATRGSTFNVYTDYTAMDNHYYPSNLMGDALEEEYFSISHEGLISGNTSIKIDYQYGSKGWAGVYWTDPENNWGQRPGGYDLTGVTKLTFQARAEGKWHPRLRVLIGGIGCLDGKLFPFHDSVCGVMPDIYFDLNYDWTEYTVDLTHLKRDWSQLLGGFGIILDGPGTIYLDNIIYHYD